MVKFRTPLPSIARRFVRSESGVAAPLLGILMLLLIGFIGLAIDVGRSTLVKARLADALDAAGLAVGARLSTSDYSADAKKFVEANFAAGYVGATVKTVTATANSTKSIITLNATAEMPTAFMKLFGTKTVTVTAASEVTRAASGLELVLALDNTGSMSGSMTALKNAANQLVDQVFGSETVGQNLYVGLVPFSHTVNIGTAQTAWMNTGSLNSVDWGTTSWGGCVEAREDGLDQTDTPPTNGAANLFKAYYWPSGYAGNTWIYNFGWFKWYDITSTRGPNLMCPQEILAMTPFKSKVTSSINNMVATGNTHVNLGAVWAWRMLSPKWRGYWSGDMPAYSLPLDYGTKRMSKAAVIMTDGDNTMTSGAYTAYAKLSDMRLGSFDSATAETELDTRLKNVCSSMKAAGVIIYTVAFNNPGTTIKKLMQNCATTVSYYFDAGDSASLSAAFKTIGDSLSNLRVSK